MSASFVPPGLPENRYRLPLLRVSELLEHSDIAGKRLHIRQPMSEKLNIVMAQLNLLVGDIDGNTERIISAAKRAAVEFAADVVVFPELL